EAPVSAGGGGSPPRRLPLGLYLVVLPGARGWLAVAPSQHSHSLIGGRGAESPPPAAAASPLHGSGGAGSTQLARLGSAPLRGPHTRSGRNARRRGSGGRPDGFAATRRGLARTRSLPFSRQSQGGRGRGAARAAAFKPERGRLAAVSAGPYRSLLPAPVTGGGRPASPPQTPQRGSRRLPQTRTCLAPPSHPGRACAERPGREARWRGGRRGRAAEAKGGRRAPGPLSALASSTHRRGSSGSRGSRGPPWNEILSLIEVQNFGRSSSV
uniref:Uncharacterized protein n=1 Tax=Aquila chrysaetos chrysaetos TaxID=223781 RepID=A0A663EM21_AQUCH